jgi:hypothetical protein
MGLNICFKSYQYYSVFYLISPEKLMRWSSSFHILKNKIPLLLKVTFEFETMSSKGITKNNWSLMVTVLKGNKQKTIFIESVKQ